MILNSIFKKNVVSGVYSLFFKVIHAWLDFLFPPLCVCCKSFCRSGLFCLECWDLCSLPDPIYRCRHCFLEIEEIYLNFDTFMSLDALHLLCPQCQTKPHLSTPYATVFEKTAPALRLCHEIQETPEAIAAFSIHQWARLGWPIPDVIIPMPQAFSLAKPFALWLDVPFVDVLIISDESDECRMAQIEKNQIILLIDKQSTLYLIQKALQALREASPKRIYVLSLIHHDFCNSF